jgi:CheY-like chemotaxis protein
MACKDISMPVMNGFEATRAIRRFEADQKLKPAMIIALTGLANGRDQAEGFASGCDIYMTKPVSFKELARLLQNWKENMDAVSNPDEYDFVLMRGGLAREGDTTQQATRS